jgi:2-polyprenyl-6-methoxyphenol hydroxylase-like FAD-dependent oxidoreductase
MTSARVGACIAGGGPAGLMLGLLLAKRGAEVLVLEGHEDFEREFRGEVLQPSTAHLLDELGLLEYVKAQPHSLLETGKIRQHGREVGEFSFKRIAPQYPYAIWMPQPIFLGALLRKAEPFPSFRCWMGARVTALLEEGGRVVGVTGVRHGDEPFEVRADVVVGADGRYSLRAAAEAGRPRPRGMERAGAPPPARSQAPPAPRRQAAGCARARGRPRRVPAAGVSGRRSAPWRC